MVDDEEATGSGNKGSQEDRTEKEEDEPNEQKESDKLQGRTAWVYRLSTAELIEELERIFGSVDEKAAFTELRGSLVQAVKLSVHNLETPAVEMTAAAAVTPRNGGHNQNVLVKFNLDTDNWGHFCRTA